MRSLIIIKKRSVNVVRKIVSKEPSQMDQIQKLIYTIAIKLIHDPNSELRHSSFDYTYQIENDNYLIIIKPLLNNYSINLVEYKTRQLINNFDVYFDNETTMQITEKFEREVHKRMKSKILMKNNKVSKHLQVIINDIEDKQKM